MQTISPLKPNWKIQDGYSDLFKDRVNSESWYNHCKRYENTIAEDKVDLLAPRVESRLSLSRNK